MACYFCHVTSGRLTLVEHMAAKWLGISGIDDVDWLPADRIVAGWARSHLLEENSCLAGERDRGKGTQHAAAVQSYV